MDLSSSIGPPFIGAILATALWGMTSMQTLVYFMTYHRDPRPLKAFIIILWMLDTAHEVLCFDALWQTFTPQFGSSSVFTTFHVDFMVIYLSTSIGIHPSPKNFEVLMDYIEHRSLFCTGILHVAYLAILQ